MTDVAVHPRFTDNHWVYFHLLQASGGRLGSRRGDAGAWGATMVATPLTDVRDLLTTDTLVSGASVSRIVFGRDGKIYMSIGVPIPNRGRPGLATPKDAQDPASLFGKILRLNGRWQRAGRQSVRSPSRLPAGDLRHRPPKRRRARRPSGDR